MNELRMMLEYQAYPLWVIHDDGLENIEPHSLNISPSLADKIEQWGDRFEETYIPDDPGSSGFKNADEEKKFIAEGINLLAELKSECLGRYTVEYHTNSGEVYT